MRRYEEDKAKGICTRCHMHPAAEGKTKCLNCLDYEAVAQMVHVARLTPEEKRERNKRINLNARKRRQRRGELGICVKCGKVPAQDGRKTCRECREKQKKIMRRNRAV